MASHMLCVVAPCQQTRRRLRAVRRTPRPPPPPPLFTNMNTNTRTDLRLERQELAHELVGRRDASGRQVALCHLADTRHRLEIIHDFCRYEVGERGGHAA